MNVMSWFDGMSCGRIALDRAGIKVDSYYAAEIDKHAQKVSEKNYPDIIRLGSVKNWKEWENIPPIDLFIAGSPCQGFSNAGKGLNFDDPRSALFFTFIEALNEYRKRNPNILFLLENVKMKKEWESVITRYIGVDPIEINSALVSAQNRKRLYWTNINSKVDMFGLMQCGISQPEDKGIFLKDILQDWNDDFVIDGKARDYLDSHAPMMLEKKYLQIGGDKAKTITARMDASWNYVLIPKSGLKMVGMADDVKGHESIRRIDSADGKAPTITTMQGGNTEPKVAIVREATKKGYVEIQPGEGVDLTFPESKTRRGRKMGSKSIALTATPFEYGWWNGETYRKLTPVECERLQTVPDSYTEGVSNSQRYKMLGNGWTVDVIAHIFKHIIYHPPFGENG